MTSKIYKYIIDADDPYEQWMHSEIFSKELLSKEEFEEVVKKARESCDEHFNDWNNVANKIIEQDDRFFYPEKGLLAIINYSEDNKFDGVYDRGVY